MVRRSGTSPTTRMGALSMSPISCPSQQEFLRFYARSHARLVKHDMEYQGCPMKETTDSAGFPGGHRGPVAFKGPDKFIIIGGESSRRL